MSIESSHARLIRSLKDLMACWEETAKSWRDRQSHAFETRELRPLEAKARAAAAAMAHIAQVLARARRDCR